MVKLPQLSNVKMGIRPLSAPNGGFENLLSRPNILHNQHVLNRQKFDGSDHEKDSLNEEYVKK